MQSAIGDRKGNLLEAIRRVGALGDVRAISTFYDTEPVGYVAQPPVSEWGDAGGD